MANVINIDLTEVPEEEPLEPGEYTVECRAAKVKTPKSESETVEKMIGLTLAPVDYPEATPTFENLLIPKQSVDADMKMRWLQVLKKACTVFEVQFTPQGIDVEQFIGQRADVQLGLEEYQGVERNNVKAYLRTAN